MFAQRIARRILGFAVPLAAALTLVFAGTAAAAPPHPFGGPAVTIGCPNQGSLMSITGLTGETVAPGVIRFNSFPGAFPIPAAAQVTVAWVNTNTGQSGITNLGGVYPNLTATVNTGMGNVIATGFGSINWGSSPICQSNPAIGTFIA